MLKVLYRGARTIILDEPTAVLVPQEVDELFGNLRELKREGITVLFISHKLDEVLSVADRVTVIRRGMTIDTVLPQDVTSRQLAELMVGSELPTPQTEESTVTDRVVLSIADVTLAGAGRTVLEDVTPDLHAGEVVGIAGVEGNGRAELVEVVMGMREPARGRIELEGTDISDWDVRRIREAGVGYIPEDRHRRGLLLDSPLWENRMLGHQTQEPASKNGILTNAAARTDTERIVREYDVRTPSIHVTVGSLSGGNQQKLIIGREMSHAPKVLVASHPTRGVDVGARAAIWDLIREARREGPAVLLISADLEELIGLSDTIKVILRGRITGEFDPDVVTSRGAGQRHDRRREGRLMKFTPRRPGADPRPRRCSPSSSPSSSPPSCSSPWATRWARCGPRCCPSRARARSSTSSTAPSRTTSPRSPSRSASR
ncbi:ATP-binding cassette domain-containing protein [Janibacter limosus]|uniref:ATP-binding cassette domain-containing protein n=1 Tax=Janibacter limosus TaxID=53458 RepID=A0AC61U8L6_9MICO|nr:ATP-binding cassette domain-containing protein [Janibacter limosus]UUZ46381.1 ATP-binding cassette domain-containing protein [Janibacter limosus]